MSELPVTIIGTGIWVLVIAASFFGFAWLQHWLGWKGPLASYIAFLLSILGAVGFGCGLVALTNRVSTHLTRKRPNTDR